MVYPQLFPNFDTITTRYPPQIGCIPGVIHLKMSADKHVIHLIIALKTDFRVITYMKKKIHPRNPEIVKNGWQRKNIYFLFGLITYFSKKSHQEIPKYSKMSDKEKNTSWSLIFDFSNLSQNKSQTPQKFTQLMESTFLTSTNLKIKFVYTLSFSFC